MTDETKFLYPFYKGQTFKSFTEFSDQYINYLKYSGFFLFFRRIYSLEKLQDSDKLPLKFTLTSEKKLNLLKYYKIELECESGIGQSFSESGNIIETKKDQLVPKNLVVHSQLI